MKQISDPQDDLCGIERFSQKIHGALCKGLTFRLGIDIGGQDKNGKEGIQWDMRSQLLHHLKAIQIGHLQVQKIKSGDTQGIPAALAASL